MELERTESCCKINLFLRVTGRRADNYHTLETLFFPLAVPSDTLEVDFSAAPGIALTADSPQVPTDARNLVYRAAARYAEVSGVSPCWCFTLTKRVPVAAGLGGGSADAAAALRLLEARFGALGEEKLKCVALELGADVPFFLDPRPAAARGVGEELEFVDVGVEVPILLVNPGFPVSAKWAYRQFDMRGADASAGTLDGALAGLKSGDLEQLARHVRNDLASALWRKFPVLSLIRDELTARGALAVEVSGSGSTLFAIMPDHAAARSAAAEFNERHPRFLSIAAEGLR